MDNLYPSMRSPFYIHGLTLFPTWNNNYIYYEEWDEITYQFPNINGTTVDVGNG